ncbi:MAG: PD-(D/E)XK nuclease family protein [Planctomycetes bacterium]|nr:PD-(D/E)XK nuclease family protein [Planctomycetota bacterium]
MRASYSAISTYQNCPLQYKYQYVDKIRVGPKAVFSFGNSVHEALRWFYDIPTADPRPLDDLLEYLETCWIGDGYTSKGEETMYFYQAQGILRCFHKHNVGEFRVPVALERKFLIDLGVCKMSGRIDRLDKDPDGGFEIIDYKTSRRLPPAKILKTDLQLPIYHMAVSEVWGVEPETASFYYVLPNHKHSVTISKERIAEAKEEIARVVTAIEDKEFQPSKGPLCPWCDYIERCPLWEGKKKPDKAKKGNGGGPGLELGEAVEELALLKKVVDQKVDRAWVLAKKLTKYAREKGVDRVQGTDHVAVICEDGRVRCERDG